VDLNDDQMEYILEPLVYDDEVEVARTSPPHMDSYSPTTTQSMHLHHLVIHHLFDVQKEKL